MAVDNEMSKSIGAIFKQVFKNPGIHRNVLLKELQKTANTLKKRPELLIKKTKKWKGNNF